MLLFFLLRASNIGVVCKKVVAQVSFAHRGCDICIV